MADGPRKLGRRALLIGGGGVFAAGALGGAYLFAPWPRLEGCKWLTATEAGVGLALYEVLFDEPGAPSAAQIKFVERFDASVGMMHPTTRLLFKAGLRALELAPIPGMGARFSRLELPRRIAQVRAWERGQYHWAQAMLGFRMQVALMFFESDEGRAAGGWALGCVPTGSD